MTRFVTILSLHDLLVAASLSAAQEKDSPQEKAIAAIKRMNGFVEVDRQRTGKPVTKVHLFEGKTAGIGLGPLESLPEIEWIGLHLSDISESDLEHLKPLTKLRRLGLADVRLSDAGLKRLEGMTSLEILYLMENPITDAGLDHLQKLTKLQELGLGQTKITDAGLEKLNVFKDLRTLDLQQLKVTDAGLAHLQALTKLQKLDLHDCTQVRDAKSLRGLPLDTLNLTHCPIPSLAPLSGMPLTSLNLFGCRQLNDLTPLKGMALTSLDLGGTQIADLSPLKGMKLTTLSCYKTPVSDLSPLAEMPLTSLNLFGCPQLHDLSPLKGMNLSEVRLTPKNFTRDSLEAIRSCKNLKKITIGEKSSDALAAQEFWKRFDAGELKP